MLDGTVRTNYTTSPEVYRSEPLRRDRYGKARQYDSPGHPRGSVMRLAEWLDANEETGKTRAWLAEQLGVSAGAVDKWCNGTRKPALKKILKIEELTDKQVTPHDWITLSK
jgi:plasmid maintenance system antidote protein VapI